MPRVSGACLSILLTTTLSACGSKGEFIPRPMAHIDTDFSQIETQSATLRQTPQGCAIDATIRNRTERDLRILGITYRTFDASGQELAPITTGNVLSTLPTLGPHEAKFIALGPTAGLNCSRVARFELDRDKSGAWGRPRTPQ